jgi:hypothetical protein
MLDHIINRDRMQVVQPSGNTPLPHRPTTGLLNLTPAQPQRRTPPLIRRTPPLIRNDLKNGHNSPCPTPSLRK